MIGKVAQHNPDQGLLRYLDELPERFRDNLLARCCIAFDHVDGHRDGNYRDTLSSILGSRNAPERALNIAKLAGLIEVFLEPDDALDELWPRLAEKHGSPVFERLARDAPLRRQHLDRAREDFYALRTAELGAPAIYEWWQHQLARTVR